MSNVFFVRIHVWLRIAMVVVVARDGRARGSDDRVCTDCDVLL
jgi:hypothetical protein